MASVSISFDLPKMSGGFFARFWEIMDRRRPDAELEIKMLLLNSAKTGHRKAVKGRHYKNQTGRLQRSTRVKGNLALGNEITLYIDTPEVPYAKYVINPHGTWTGDPFINEAIDYHEFDIYSILKNLYADAIEEFNNLP